MCAGNLNSWFAAPLPPTAAEFIATSCAVFVRELLLELVPVAKDGVNSDAVAERFLDIVAFRVSDVV